MFVIDGGVTEVPSSLRTGSGERESQSHTVSGRSLVRFAREGGETLGHDQKRCFHLLARENGHVPSMREMPKYLIRDWQFYAAWSSANFGHSGSTPSIAATLEYPHTHTHLTPPKLMSSWWLESAC
jgi:hypothetical protein